MARELIVESDAKKQKIVLLDQGKIVEYHEEDTQRPYKVGDIYVGRVKNFSQNLNAALIELGHAKAGFLHYLDLGLHFDKFDQLVHSKLQPNKKQLSIGTIALGEPIPKDGNIADALKKDQKILVQVSKEPINTKGLRVVAHFTFVGRHMLLLPMGNKVNISKKITDKGERERLKRLIKSIKPKNFSITVRTAAQHKDVAVLDQELQGLVKTYENALQKLQKKRVGDRVMTEVSKVSSILRDLLHEKFNQIIVDNVEAYEEIKNYIAENDPSKAAIVQLHTSKTKLLEHFGLDRELKRVFAPMVSIEGGGHLIIEVTEGATVIDINSGALKTEHERLPLKVNLAALKEIIRQMRLRNLGGNIIIDFIGMPNAKDKELVYKTFKEYLKSDSITTKILPISEFGIMEITRKRSRSAVKIEVEEVCGCCRGKGKTENPLSVIHWIENEIKALKEKKISGTIYLYVHPFVYAYLHSGLISRAFKWRLFYKSLLKIVSSPQMPLNRYKFVNKSGEIVGRRPTLKLRHP